MAGPAAVTVGTALSNILSALTPGQLFNLGHHLTASDGARALALLGSMTNPTMAAALVGSLASIPNLPPEVMTWVSAAMANPANFMTEMATASAAVQRAMTSPGVLGGLTL
jgi:hypothetical protein